MKITTKTIAREMIQFRCGAGDEALQQVFFDNVERLGVSESDLARRAVRRGLKQAIEEIADEKLKQTKAQLAKLQSGKGNLVNFKFPPQMFVNANQLFA